MDPFTAKFGLTLTTKALAGIASTVGGMIAKQLFTRPPLERGSWSVQFG